MWLGARRRSRRGTSCLRACVCREGDRKYVPGLGRGSDVLPRFPRTAVDRNDFVTPLQMSFILHQLVSSSRKSRLFVEQLVFLWFETPPGVWCFVVWLNFTKKSKAVNFSDLNPVFILCNILIYSSSLFRSTSLFSFIFKP